MPRTVKKDKHLQPGEPLKPSTLSPRAAAEWDRLMGELAASNIRVTPGHRSLLSLAATIAADIVEAWSAIRRDGAYIETKVGMAAHPATKRMDALRRDRIKVLTMLGLRCAVAKETPAKEKTLEEILDQ